MSDLLPPTSLPVGPDRNTATLYLLCGLPGSGKTTLAKELEASGVGILLNGDEWVCRLYPQDAEVAARDGRKSRVEAVQWELAERLLASGTDVVLDWGVWSRGERDHLRQRANAVGADVEIIFLDVPLRVLHRRVARRNRDLPAGCFSITPDELDHWAELFEPPTADELS